MPLALQDHRAFFHLLADAILGVGKLEKRVVVREVGGQDAILIRPMAYVTLTIDHRVVDGATGAVFLADVKALLEDPVGMLL